MNNLIDLNRKAHELRKTGRFGEALEIYREAWDKHCDKFSGAGLLHCLRKLKLFEEAVPLADELTAKFSDFNWARIEVIWTYIETIPKKGNNISFQNVLCIANKILLLNPELTARNRVIFKVLQNAKEVNDWNIIKSWLDKLEPATLDTEPMEDSSGRKGWSQLALWYNFKINCLIKEEKYDEAELLVSQCLGQFPKVVEKFFIRLKAIICNKLGKLTEAEMLYSTLCKGRKVDWWLLYEYANTLNDIGQSKKALELMYQATSTCKRLDSMVNLLFDIASLCKDLGRHVESRSHIALSINIRQKNGWMISPELNNILAELNNLIGNNQIPTNVKDALAECKNYWVNSVPPEDKVLKNLIGKLKLGLPERPYCYILTKDSKSYFSYKSNLPQGAFEGEEVKFDIVPSFDKKKNRDSWKATNIRSMKI